MKSLKTGSLFATAILTCTLALRTQAGIVHFVGQENNASSFRTTTVTKSFDPNGNNVYGEAGYVLYTTEKPPSSAAAIFNTANPLTYNDGTYRTLSSMPSYLSLANNGQDSVVGGNTYPLVDDPTAVPGPTVTKILSGLGLENNIDVGTEESVLNVNVGAGFPSSGLLIGVMLASGGDMMSSVRLTQTAGTGSGTATASVTTAPNLAFEFFDLTGAKAGDTYTLFLTKTGNDANPNVAYAGLTFDQIAVPEPTTLSLLSVGCVSLLARRRRA